MNALTSYLSHVRDEFKHIVWPTPRTALAHTLVIILIALFVAAMIGVLDYAFGGLVSSLIGA